MFLLFLLLLYPFSIFASDAPDEECKVLFPPVEEEGNFVIKGDILKTHPIDLLIEKQIQKLSQESFSFRTDNIDQYSSGILIRPYSILVSSKLQRKNSSDAEADFCHIFEMAINVYNSIPEIRPYLKMFPISTRDLNVSLYYELAPRVYQKPPYFCLVHIPSYYDKYLEFRRWTAPTHFSITSLPIAGKKEYALIPALQKYMEASVLRKKTRIEKPIILDKDFQWQVVGRLCSKYQLHISTLSHGAIGDFHDYRELCAGFWAQNKNISFDEARIFSKKLMEELLIEIRNKRVVEKNFRKESSAQQKMKDTLDWFYFQITFWDEYLNRVEEPYIAQIQCQDGKILYFTADEGQRLQQIFEEPIPEQFFPENRNIDE